MKVKSTESQNKSDQDQKVADDSNPTTTTPEPDESTETPTASTTDKTPSVELEDGTVLTAEEIDVMRKSQKEAVRKMHEINREKQKLVDQMEEEKTRSQEEIRKAKQEIAAAKKALEEDVEFYSSAPIEEWSNYTPKTSKYRIGDETMPETNTTNTNDSASTQSLEELKQLKKEIEETKKSQKEVEKSLAQQRVGQLIETANNLRTSEYPLVDSRRVKPLINEFYQNNNMLPDKQALKKLLAKEHDHEQKRFEEIAKNRGYEKQETLPSGNGGAPPVIRNEKDLEYADPSERRAHLRDFISKRVKARQ
jgi:hypothetical protein